MATKTKIERERQRLIEKYGDAILVKIIDYYYPTYVVEGSDKEQDLVVAVISLSQVRIDNTADLKEVERRLMEGKPIVRKWKFPQSEKLYNSPEEVERRKQYIKEHNPWMSTKDIFLPMLIKDTIDEPDGEGQIVTMLS